MQGSGASRPGQDPGWKSVVGSARRARPGGAAAPGATPVDPLLQLRLVFVAMTSAVVLIGPVTAVITSGQTSSSLSASTGAAVVAGAGALALLVTRLVDPVLDCGSEETLRMTYRMRFFLRMAFAEATALVAFVVVMMTGEPLLYVLGLAFTAVGFLRAAPSAHNLRRDEEHLATSGCAHPLTATLRTPR